MGPLQPQGSFCAVGAEQLCRSRRKCVSGGGKSAEHIDRNNTAPGFGTISEVKPSDDHKVIILRDGKNGNETAETGENPAKHPVKQMHDF